MEVVIAPDPAGAAELVADVVERVVRTQTAPVLGLATGSSPLTTYRCLVRRHRAGALSFAGASAVLLDEYVGLPPGHPESYRTFIGRELVDLIDLPVDRVHGPDVWADDLAGACVRYDRLLGELGGVDLQLLGIGSDGHIGFNEPGSSLGSRTRIKTLTESTRRDNARFFASLDEVPRHVVTQGLATIGEARHVLLVATGADKAAPLARAVEGPLTAMCPASVLQLHPHATVVVDEAAAAGLELADYYRSVYAGKPSWQHL
ncbi:MAG: glucosamine-6-phosphate deaminase [Ilumatobacteraceae bacterium]